MGMNSILVFLITGVLSSLLTLLFMRVALKFNTPIDIPYMSKSHAIHKKPVPTGGGIPLFVVFWTMLLLLYKPDWKMLLFFFLSLFLLSFGLLDDIKNLGAGLKLFYQGMSGFAFYLLFKPEGYNLGWFTIPSGFPSLLFTIFLFMVIVNGLNFLDGIDGLSSTYTLVMLIFMGIIYGEFNYIYIYIFAGVIAGFLFWNIRKQRVFLGDAGVYFFTTILMYILLKPDHSYINMFPFGVLFAVPLMDLGGAVVRRLKKGITPLAPDTEHIHHRLLEGFRNHYLVVLIYLIVVTILGFLAILSNNQTKMVWPITGFFFLIWIMMLFLFKWL